MTENDPPAGTPRWVKVFAVLAILAVVLLVILLVVGGEHGPGRHTSAGEGAQAHAGAQA